MEPAEVFLSDGDESFVLFALWTKDGWVPRLFRIVGDQRHEDWPVSFASLPRLFPTPGRCILAMAEVVVTELFGVRA